MIKLVAERAARDSTRASLRLWCERNHGFSALTQCTSANGSKALPQPITADTPTLFRGLTLTILRFCGSGLAKVNDLNF
jgi:hypothetical protein